MDRCANSPDKLLFARSLFIFSLRFFAARRKLRSRIHPQWALSASVRIPQNSNLYIHRLDTSYRYGLSLIQKDILITLITLYHQQSHSIKKARRLRILSSGTGYGAQPDAVLKGGRPCGRRSRAERGVHPHRTGDKELNLSVSGGDYDVPISRDGEVVKGAHVQEIDFTTLCHPDICHAVIRLVGSAKIFEIGDKITIGPTPVNKS